MPFQYLAGAAVKNKTYTYPEEDIEIFFTLMFSHLVAGVTMLIFEVIKCFNINPVISGATTNLLVSFFYILTIIYVIWKNRMLVTNLSE